MINILSKINIIPQAYAGGSTPSTGTSLGSIVGVGQFQENLSDQSLTGKFISSMITTITIAGSLAFVIYFFIGALTWITAGGDKTKIGAAQSQMTQGAIGLIALVSSYFIIGIIGAVLGLDILNPIKAIQKFP